MTYEFCTLFDANYLSRGLVLYHSLVGVGADFRIRVLCMDASTERILVRLNLPQVTVVSLPQLESHNRALAAVKSDRTPVEYCWTTTPAICLYSLETEPELLEITYLDADLMFFSDPAPLFEEFADDSVLIVPHRYAPEHREKAVASGIYNVEWLTFKRDEHGLTALRWWHDRCIEWCYNRVEDGKMGDQKYLDDWPDRFEGVHVLEHPGGGLAPWNVSNHDLGSEGCTPTVDGRPLVFYHHHALRVLAPRFAARLACRLGVLRPAVGRRGNLWSTNYPVSRSEQHLIWEPYLRSFDEQVDAVSAIDVGLAAGVVHWSTRDTLRTLNERSRRRVRALLGRLRALDPVRFVPGRFSRYRNSWRSRDVAARMLVLTNAELEQPTEVAPYRAFLELLPTLTADPDLQAPARLLDIGCGVGAYSELLDRYARGRFEYVGADYSTEILAVARERWPGREFVERDVFAGGALDGFDVILGSALVDVQADFERALRVLCAADARWLLLHRQQITSARSRAEVAPGYPGQRTYRSYVRIDELHRIAAEYGRRVVTSARVAGDVRSFLLLREDAHD